MSETVFSAGTAGTFLLVLADYYAPCASTLHGRAGPLDVRAGANSIYLALFNRLKNIVKRIGNSIVWLSRQEPVVNGPKGIRGAQRRQTRAAVHSAPGHHSHQRVFRTHS